MGVFTQVDTVLTSGTHPPYETPESSNDKARAFALASQSVRWFVDQLRADGLLDDALVPTRTRADAGSGLVPFIGSE